MLGPEKPLPSGSGPVLAERLAGRGSPIKTVLLDQAVVAGLGNIYVCESLFGAGIDPLRPASSVTAAESDRLAATIRAVLERAIAAGGSSLKDYRQASGELGYFQHQFAVYGREGEACPACAAAGRAGVTVRRVVQAGRSTFFCPRCQP